MSDVNGEQIVNVPNTITIGRAIGSLYESYKYARSGDILDYVKAGACYGLDVVDGPSARLLHQETEFGKALDPVADKLTVAGLTISAHKRREIDPLVATVIGTVNGMNALATVVAKARDVPIDVDSTGKWAQFWMNCGAGANVIGNNLRRNGDTLGKRISGHILRWTGIAVTTTTGFTLGVESTAQYVRAATEYHTDTGTFPVDLMFDYGDDDTQGL